MTSPLRVGIIGCGSIARAHAAALRFVADDGLVRTVAVADPDAAGMARVAQILGGVDRTYPDGYQLLNDPEVDAVVLITPTRFHRDYIAAGADAGKPLFTEKPLAPTYPVVREIVDLVRASNLPVQVGFQSRFHPLYRHAHGLISGGDHGAPMAYTLRDDQFWPTGAVIPGHSDWRSVRAEAGGGALLEHSIHSCDLVSWLFGPARRVHATTRAVFGYDVEDVAALVIEHESGVVGTLLTVFNGVRAREERRLEIFLEQASIEITTDFIIGAPEDSFLIHRADAPDAERLDVGQLRRVTIAADGFDPDREVFVYQYFAHRAFAAAVRDGMAPSPGIDDALRAHQIVEAAYRSAASRQPVEISQLG
ncbi:MAG TPA: Gfo/Idh/MocA family oxidoreductase [Acidimicrobiales bacterium]|nr:Gfo/Idh/MocA family oxidoreductase [Acidimicrobiales bacterium]